jgi:hypothetical protein
MIEIDLRSDTVALGDPVEAQVSWQVDGRQPDGVVIEVGWITEGRGTVNRATVSQTRIDIDADDSFATPWTSFTAIIPEDAPVSYDGTLIRIRWGVHVRLDIPWAKDEKAGEEFRVHVREVG